MKFLLRFLAITIVVFLAIDFYSFQAVKTLTSSLSDSSRRTIHLIFWSFTAFTIGTLLYNFIVPFYAWPKFFRNYLTAFIMMFYVGKLLMIPFLLMDDLIRLARWIASSLSAPKESVAPDEARISRWEFLCQAALFVGTIPVVAMTYGMIYGGYDYKVRRVRLNFPNLPAGFDGLKVLQISDLHVGSFLDTKPLEHAFRIIDKQKADIILFTGDLVNNITEETEPFIHVLGQLKAPMGVYSILGNHDYGDYSQWDSEEQKRANHKALIELEQSLGWTLLRNENRILQRGADRIALAGSENWGKGGHWPKYGNLDQTYSGLEHVPFTLLMSHDPSHWEGQVLDHPHKADLMLAGHTHGMQFGVDTKWLKWSPVQYFYKQWAGLYEKNGSLLYVNRGLGFIGYPGRAGIRPEITVFELRRSA